MQKLLVLNILFLIYSQNLTSQNLVEIKYNQAVEAYNLQDYKMAISIVNGIKPLYKSVPPKVAYLEIISNFAIILSDTSYSFQILQDTRKLISKYLNVNAKRKNDNYYSIQEINGDLSDYPKDQISFNQYIEAQKRDDALKKEKEKKAASEFKVKQEKEKLEAIARKEKEVAELKLKRERDRISNIEAQKQAEINRQAIADAQAERDMNARKYAETKKKRIKNDEKKERRSLNSFSSLGFQSGEIAKFGVLYERGGRKTIGFNFVARSSLIPESDILSGAETINKTEATLGINCKISKRFYLNIATGYGYSNFANRNNFARTVNLESKGYTVSSAGLMIRISRIININGGISFMDIENNFYNSEIIFGLSFNLKDRYKQ